MVLLFQMYIVYNIFNFQLEIDFSLIFANNHIHRSVLNHWDEFSNFFLQKAFQKTKLNIFDERLIENEGMYTQTKIQNNY